MSTIEHDNDASLAGFLAGWGQRLQENEQLPVSMALLVLTNFGERPVPQHSFGRGPGPVRERGRDAGARTLHYCEAG